MLINLSNHPSSFWDSIQQEAAHIYGNIVDLPFPNIEPKWDIEEIKLLTQEYANKCFHWINESNENSEVHVMGEMTFWYDLLKLLRAYQIKCIDSTTQRKVVLKGDNKKEVEFKFVRLRSYE